MFVALKSLPRVSMKVSIASAVAVCILCVCQIGFARTPQPTWDPNGNYVLTFDDEFNSTSVNVSIWEEGWYLGLGNSGLSGPVNSSEIACYGSSDVTEPGDGYLHLKLTHTTSDCSGGSHPYTGALVDTRESFSQVGGSFEARIYLPPKGSRVTGWPAWWQNGPDSDPWPQHGEIDSVEGLGGATAAHLHYVDSSGNDEGPGYYTTVPLVGWHTFGEKWDATAQTVTFYYDGKEVWSSPFLASDPEYLIFDYSMGANSPKPSSPQSEMLVDWVRVWQ